MGTAQVVFCHPNDQSLQKTLKRLHQLHQFALANLLAQLLMKNEFRNLKQQLRMFEGIFDFLCNQCIEKKKPECCIKYNKARFTLHSHSFSCKCDSFRDADGDPAVIALNIFSSC